eukprot:gb/GFBE01081736.1/.p1 GENE.gb/GFBE01081736.1/~~gb/GFBE01081736.1/.p1  ORF type:complete len:700 (+),score=129.05 gb/GFBE01081736.1/:1-2100(+)
MGQASHKESEIAWAITANCSCVPQAGNAVENVGGDIKKRYDTFESESEPGDVVGESLPVLPRRQELVLARRRVFSPHLRSSFSTHYRIVRQVGEGTYGNVFEAETKAPTAAGEGRATSSSIPRRVAVKCFKISQVSSDDTGMNVKTLKESFEKERAILARAEHPHIVKMYECFEEQERSSLWVVLELCRGGELYEYVAARAQQRRAGGGAFDEPEARLFFRQMLHAVGFLHTSRIVHRDIKTENFLLLGDPATPDGSIIKLCDFGTAMQLSDEMPRAMGRIGTLSYTAPEIYARRGADLCADLWSLGVVLYVLLVGASPFRTTGAEPRAETSKRIVAGNYDTSRPGWESLSDNAKDMVSKLLVVEETSRLKLSAAMQHAWMEPCVPLPFLKTSSMVEQHRVLSPISTQEVDLADYAVHIQRLLHLITRFARLDPLQQLLISVYAQVTPDSELAQLDLKLPWYELFFALDEDDDGRLGFAELTRGLQRLVSLSMGDYDPKQEAKVNALVKALDLDGSGYVDWVEWTALALSSCKTLAQEPEPLLTVFRMVDRPSGDGAVSAVDLLALLNSDSAGRSLSTAQAQEQAGRLLSKWAPQRSKASKAMGGAASPTASNGVAASVPTLLLEDIRAVLQAAAEECSQPSDSQLPWLDGGRRRGAVVPAKQAGWLRCCEQTQSDIRPEMVSKVPAIGPPEKDNGMDY